MRSLKLQLLEPVNDAVIIPALFLSRRRKSRKAVWHLVAWGQGQQRAPSSFRVSMGQVHTWAPVTGFEHKGWQSSLWSSWRVGKSRQSALTCTGYKACVMATYSGQLSWAEGEVSERGCCHLAIGVGNASCGLGAHWTRAVYMLSISSRQESQPSPSICPSCNQAIALQPHRLPEAQFLHFLPALSRLCFTCFYICFFCYTNSGLGLLSWNTLGFQKHDSELQSLCCVPSSSYPW